MKQRNRFDLSMLDALGSAENHEALAAVPTNQVNAVIALGIDQICEDPTQPRKEFNTEALNELAEDIQLRGLLQPIVVCKAEGGKHKIIHGERRWRAAKQAGLQKINAIIETNSRDDYAQVAENSKRSDLTHLEMMEFIVKKSESGSTGKEIARGLGINVSKVSWYMALANAPVEIKDLAKGKCSDLKALYELVKWSKENKEAALEFIEKNSKEDSITMSMVVAARKGADEKSNASDATEKEALSGTNQFESERAEFTATDASNTDQEEGTATGDMQAKELPYHDSRLDNEGSATIADPSKIKKPLLLGKHKDQPIKILLSRKPTTDGLIHIQYEDTMEEAEIAIGDVVLTLLTEMRVQEKN